MRGERDGYDPRAGIRHADGEIFATEPRAQRPIVALDVDPRDPGDLNAVTGAETAWVRFRRSLPGDEERQERLAARIFQTGAPPSDLGPVGSFARTCGHVEPESPRHSVEVVRRYGDGEPSAATLGSLEHRPSEPRSRRDGLVFDPDQLDVIVAEGNDAVCRPPPWMAPSARRVEAVVAAEPIGGGAEVRYGKDDVVDPEHDAGAYVRSIAYARGRFK